MTKREEVARHPQTVVIVDDDEDLARCIGVVFEHAGFRSVVFADKTEAHDWIVRNSTDLVISDIQSPGMNGLEFIERLKNNPRTKDIPFIFLSDYTSPERIAEALVMGASRYVIKPGDVNDLVAEAEGVLGKREIGG